MATRLHRYEIVWLCLLAIWAGAAAQAEDYPSRPVKIIADAPAGSSPDVSLRIVADRLSQIWGQQVVALNHPGAGGAIAARVAAGAASDGYTLYMPALSAFLALPGRPANMPLKLPADFAPIGFVAEQPMIIAAAPSLGVATLPELIALAKKRPGEIPYAVTGVGRLTHLAGELLQRRTDIKLLLVPYVGGPAQSLNDIMGGRVSVIIEGISGIAGALQAGALRPLAVASPQRLPEFPDVPTVAETVPGFAATGWQALVAPLGTPETVVRKVSDDLHKALTDPVVKSKLAAIGGYVRPMSPAEVTTFVQREQQQWNPLLSELTLKPKE